MNNLDLDTLLQSNLSEDAICDIVKTLSSNQPTYCVHKWCGYRAFPQTCQRYQECRKCGLIRVIQ